MSITIPNSEKILIIACGMLAREILAIKEQLKFDHLELTCLPANHHFEPQKIAPDMDVAITKAKANGYIHILAGYGDCGTGGYLDKVLKKHGVERLNGPHCFAFYQGMENFNKIGDDDMTSFYMTDFLCRHFESFFIKPLGIDRYPQLIKDYFGHYETLIYLAQTDDEELEKTAKMAAQMLNLTYQKRFTGYGDLNNFIQKNNTNRD